jgi:diadenosine tetraphosphate (Ap4A) HIT family hydrolase
MHYAVGAIHELPSPTNNPTGPIKTRKEAPTVPCPFCQLPSERILHSNAHAHIIRDGFPISPGHTLIIPKRHIASFFDTTPEERNALLELLDWAKAELETNPPPRESFNHLGEPASNHLVNETEHTSPTCETGEAADKKFTSPSCETSEVANKEFTSPTCETNAVANKKFTSPTCETNAVANKEFTSPSCETNAVADKKFTSPSCETGGVAERPGGLPHAYNIGINDGPAAGQTVPHLHIHLIPRYRGDSKDPRGGVRWIMPEKADYWSGK